MEVTMAVTEKVTATAAETELGGLQTVGPNCVAMFTTFTCGPGEREHGGRWRQRWNRGGWRAAVDANGEIQACSQPIHPTLTTTTRNKS